VSTRCQVVVIQEGLGWKEKVTLYHHSDGYPENIVPLINKALQGHIKDKDARLAEWKLSNHNEGNPDWQMGRAGKVAGRLCWADADQFEPEDSHALHGDIEYYYKLYVVNGKNEGSFGADHTWELEILVPTDGFCDNSGEGNMKVKHKRQPLENLLELYPPRWESHEA
jgi:hypothetical protein